MAKIEISEEIKELMRAYLGAILADEEDKENGQGEAVIFDDLVKRVKYFAFSDGEMGGITFEEYSDIMKRAGKPCLYCRLGSLTTVFNSMMTPVLHLGCNRCYHDFTVADGDLCLID